MADNQYNEAYIKAKEQQAEKHKEVSHERSKDRLPQAKLFPDGWFLSS
ncbi:MAG: hypothetical protein HYT39_03410 [Candidatus Sungbacteria bacterium]|nr:hypothetical protein [Candidatus Sungbacteria bacterium]